MGLKASNKMFTRSKILGVNIEEIWYLPLDLTALPFPFPNPTYVHLIQLIFKLLTCCALVHLSLRDWLPDFGFCLSLCL